MFKAWTIRVVVTVVALLTLALPASAQRPAKSAAPAPVVVPVQRFVVVRPFPGWYDPWWWGPPAYAPYAPVDYTGNVKIVTDRKDAAVYVDGGFAGLAGKLKKFPLQPGTHTVEFRDSDGRRLYQERVHVIAGKTVKIHLG